MKRLVCLLDGNCGEEDRASAPTNVAKLSRAILPKDGNNIRQLVRDVVGTSRAERITSLKDAFGLTVSDRIRAAYLFLSNRYEPGDEIYLSGFSRGAYEARSLASFVTLFGIARRQSDFCIDRAWSIYRKREKKRNFDTVAEISASCHYPVRIRCLGLWDTVENTGDPYRSAGSFRRRFDRHDTRLHDTIDVSLHALSIDEPRRRFQPTLLTYPEDVALPTYQHVEQTWFAGTHGDVGGGWPETELSDIALLWMAERIRETTDLALDIDKLRHETKPDPLGTQHDPLTGWARFAAPRGRRASEPPPGLRSLNEAVHPSALSRLGQTVKEARGHGVPRDIVYAPRFLEPALTGRDAPDEPHSTPMENSSPKAADVRS
jgi:uncharacterized protein (DUF2235 family)